MPPAKVVINATGAFSDRLRRIAEPDAAPMIAPSQGIHLVFDGAFLAGESAIMVPHTSDGRVLFAIPWHGHTLVGTTDTAIPAATLEPVAMDEEIDFILSTAGQYLAKAPTRDDVLSVFAGVRPLVRAAKGEHGCAFARPCDPYRSLWIDKRHGRKVDDLSAHGGGLRRPGSHTCGVARTAVRYAGSAHSRISCRRERVWFALGVWFGCVADSQTDRSRCQPGRVVCIRRCPT